MNYKALEVAIAKLPKDKMLSLADLKTVGIKHHNDKMKALEMRLLEKIGRGVYRKPLSFDEQRQFNDRAERENEWQNKYDEFVRDIMLGRFCVAYKKLIWLLSNRLNNNFDDNMSLYLILLEEFLEIKDSFVGDFNFVLGEKIDNNYSQFYYSYYFDFLRLVEKADFLKALEQLKMFVRFERNHKQYNSQNTEIVQKLVLAIVNKNKVSVDDKDINEIVEAINLNYGELSKAIRRVNFEFTEENLLVVENLLRERIRFFSGKDDLIVFDRYACDVIEIFKIIQRGRIPFAILGRANYEKTDIIDRFIEAISLKEYCSAYEMSQDDNWSKNAKRHPKSQYLFLYKRLLFKMNSIFKKNNTNGSISKIDISFTNYECSKSDNYVELLKWLEQEIQKDNCDYILLNELWQKKVLVSNFDNDLINEINMFFEVVSYFQKNSLVGFNDRNRYDCNKRKNSRRLVKDKSFCIKDGITE